MGDQYPPQRWSGLFKFLHKYDGGLFLLILHRFLRPTLKRTSMTLRGVCPSRVVRRNTMPEPKSKNSLDTSLYGTPRLLSSSSIPSPSRPGMLPSSRTTLILIDQVSDYFSRPSRLNKSKLSFYLKTNRQVTVDKQSDRDSIAIIGLLFFFLAPLSLRGDKYCLL